MAIGQEGKMLFLEECTDEVTPVVCLDVRPGSVIVTFEGTASQLQQKTTEIKKYGLMLFNFPVLKILKVDDSKSAPGDSKGLDPMLIIVIGGSSAVLVALALVYFWWRKSKKTTPEGHIDELGDGNNGPKKKRGAQ